MFRSSVLALGLATALAAAAPSASNAAILGVAPASSGLIQPVQFFFNPLDLLVGGREYCWYDDGWRGPGWYWCGYGYRDGYGWGGGEGWHGFEQHRSEGEWRLHHGGGEMRRHDEGGVERRRDEGGFQRQDNGFQRHDNGGFQHHDNGGGERRHEGGGGNRDSRDHSDGAGRFHNQ